MLLVVALLLPLAFAADPGPLLTPAPIAEPVLTAGPVLNLPFHTPVPVDSLSLTSCAVAPPAPADVRPGTLVFEVQLRRGHVSLVSVVSADTAVAGYRPCLQRVLTDYAWPVKRANLRVPVNVEPSPTPPAAPAQPVPAGDR